MTRYAKAYSADYWGKISELYNRCEPQGKIQFKKNLKNQVQRVLQLIDNENNRQGNLSN